MMRRFFATLARDRRGITVVEFGLVAPVLLLMMMGFFDLSHRAYATAVLQGAVEQAGRAATLESGADGVTATSIDDDVTSIVRDIVGRAGNVSVQRLNYSSFNDVAVAERFVDAPPGNGRYDAGECFEDYNANGVWDADRGRTGQGGAQEVTAYRATLTFDRMFPMAGLLGWSRQQTVTASTVLRNQPYANQRVVAVAVCP